jgi:hypothetical protein
METFTLIRQLSGNANRSINAGGTFLMSCLCLLLSAKAVAQTTSKWEWNLTATVHPPSFIKQTSGIDKIQIRPSVGWEFGFSREIYSKNRIKIDFGYNRGSTPVHMFINVKKNEYQFLRDDYITSFYYVQHPYNSFYFRARKEIFSGKSIGMEIANRFYPSSVAVTGIGGRNAITNARIQVFRSRTQTTSYSMLSPHLKLSFTGTIWKRFPSFLYEASLCYAPISVIDGFFVLFPNSPGYTSSGTFQVQQSYFGLGIKYRRVRKVKKQ